MLSDCGDNFNLLCYTYSVVYFTADYVWPSSAVTEVMVNKLEQREIAARSAALKFFGAAHLVCDLKPGDWFTFPKSDKLHRYSGRGWYRSAEHRKAGRVGMFTAVIKKNKE